jgi:poly(A) polymerase
MSLQLREFARAVAGRLKQAGYPVYLAGGCVRDRLLGREIKDFDLATPAPPDAIRRLIPGALEVGAHFGVVIVRDAGMQVQVAAFRTDHSYKDGRRPEAVTFETDPRRDVLRRDFTINGLLEDPFTGEIIDHVGGRSDLEARLIRAIGGPRERFAEDRLRMLRAVRFAARLGFMIEPETMAAIAGMASLVSSVSAERVRDELTMILTEGGARRGMELLDQSGLLAHVLPEAARMKGVPQPQRYHPEGDVWTHTLHVLGQLPACSPVLGWAALLHDVGKPETMTVAGRIRFHGHGEAGARIARSVLERLRFPAATVEAAASLVANHTRFKDVPAMGPATFKRFIRLPWFDELLALHRCDRLGAGRSLEVYEEVIRRRSELRPEDVRPEPLLDGDALIGLGYRPGPQFREILDALEEAQLDGAVRTRGEAVEFVTRRFPRWPESGEL